MGRSQAVYRFVRTGCDDDDDNDNDDDGDDVVVVVVVESVAVSKKSASWTSTFETTVLQEDGRRSDVAILAQTFWTPHSQNVCVICVTLKKV